MGKVRFLNEALPSSKEPGGPEMREFVLPFVPEDRLEDAWVSILRQQRQKETERDIMLRAWNWIDEHASSIRLKDIVGDAVNALIKSSNADYSLLVTLGHWAKHRNRADLLTQVVVESMNGPISVPVGEALLADPYVEHGHDRRRLFTAPAIVAAYLDNDPNGGGAHGWRAFLENVGAKGALEVHTVKAHASRRNREDVSEFLGLCVGEIEVSNNSGYELRDFDIAPSLPDPKTPKELRAALATWLDDGLSVVIGTGLREYHYWYYKPYADTGSTPSAWVTKLSELAWVPCGDGILRCPQDALTSFDPARKDAPVAQLSSKLLSVLEEEGVEFGSAIPVATSICRLSALGSQLDADELAHLISECRKQVTTAKDRIHFDRALRNVTVPFQNDERVPLNRIVGRVGRSLRGALGGWISPLNEIEEPLRKELEHSNFPWEFPDTTTGGQALDYIRDVWKRAPLASKPPANEVRDVLPFAYAYCLEDCAKDAGLSLRWNDAVRDATVFAEGRWVTLTEADDIYFDDIEDRRFFPSHVNLRSVTAGHLGRTRSEQLRTAKALGLPLLSSSINMEWQTGLGLNVSHDWYSRFDLIRELVRQVRGNDPGQAYGPGSKDGTKLRLVRIETLALNVSVESSRMERIPVNARLHEDVLTVMGSPVQFASDAAKELLRSFSFGQRGDLAADLTGMLVAIDSRADFNLAADKFRRAFAHDFEVPQQFSADPHIGNWADSGDEMSPTNEGTELSRKNGTGTDKPTDPTDSSETSEYGETDTSRAKIQGDTSTGNSKKPNNNEPDSKGGSYTKERALAQQNALAKQLKKVLKGEITPSGEQEDADEDATISIDTNVELGDEEYREIAVQYEREAERKPQLGDPRQTGWDIRSTDPKTGEIRLIEVKGKGCRWDENEVVELGRAQVRKAFQSTDEQANESWYLYVVEKDDNGQYQVLPIENPVQIAAKWILAGKSWRMLAVNQKHVVDPLG